MTISCARGHISPPIPLRSRNMRVGRQQARIAARQLLLGMVELPPLEERTQWRRQQNLVRQTTASPQPIRYWKMNHAKNPRRDGMWQGEEEELTARTFAWVCTRRGKRENGTNQIFQPQYDLIQQISEDDKMLLAPKTIKGNTPTLKGYLRIGKIRSCEELEYPEFPGEEGWFRFEVDWEQRKITVEPGDPLRQHPRGISIREVHECNL